MTIIEMLGQSGTLTLLGMAIVFAFLTVMIFCINIVGKIIHKMGLDKDVENAAPVSRPAAKSAAAPAVSAAISAAVQEYRKDTAAGESSGKYIVNVNGNDYNINYSTGGAVPPAAEKAVTQEKPSAPASGVTLIPAPVAGTVIRYIANEGDHVSVGDTVVIIESMKMELEIKATVNGVIHFIASQGAQIVSQQPLAEIRS